ncbi:hypothetical protein [Lachnobacterium bovis]|uniref:hypothetical protein n=1 Tax=Lachnobacterium bovis TaxID=140626 RepID=UPI0018658CC9|nr:hypothetical protein [Lachnobacterium bovis]
MIDAPIPKMSCEEVKESELTDMYTAFTIYNSVNAKKILEKDRFADPTFVYGKIS